MLKHPELIPIRQYCLTSAINILLRAKEPVTLERHLAVAQEIQDFLLQELNLKKVSLFKE